MSCCVKKQEVKNDATKNNIYNLTERRIVAIDSVVTDRKHEIIFLFNYYDCGSCVDLGFSITKRIDSLSGYKKVGVVSTMGNPSSYQIRNKYYNYIYIDEKDLIRKELKYVQTPIIFSLDSLNCVKDYILPNVSGEEEVESFIREFERKNNM